MGSMLDILGYSCKIFILGRHFPTDLPKLSPKNFFLANMAKTNFTSTPRCVCYYKVGHVILSIKDFEKLNDIIRSDEVESHVNKSRNPGKFR